MPTGVLTARHFPLQGIEMASSPDIAYRYESLDGSFFNCVPFNATGQPALTVPCAQLVAPVTTKEVASLLFF